MVQNCLFPNGLKSSYFKVIPPLHNKFENLESVVQELLNVVLMKDIAIQTIDKMQKNGLVYFLPFSVSSLM